MVYFTKLNAKFASEFQYLNFDTFQSFDMKLPLSISVMIASLAAMPSLAAAEEAPAPRLQDNSNPVTSEILRLDVEARFDYQYVTRDGDSDDAASGFEGKYLVMRLDGMIAPGLTYSWRQRFNKDASFFNATDWVYLNYATGRWNFQAGKEVVAIGGYEYDRAPIDLYGCSVFWNNIPCYAFGVSAGYGITDNDRLTFQVTESPFAYSGNRNMYGYNLMWNGSHGFFDAIYSANLMEYAKGHYISYLALGNKFSFNKVWLELDFMNRAASHQTFLFKDCSVMAELSYSPDSRWRIYGKYTYDVNKTGTGADLVVADGTELNMAGAGFEFFPLMKKRHRLRLHAGLYYSWGKNGNPDNLMQSKTMYATAGLTWDMNLLNINRK